MQITDPVLLFAFIMALILIAPFLVSRANVPGIVGLIIAGVMFGPHALGVLPASGSLELFSTVGLVYIMFLAGLEINLVEFNRQKKFTIIFGSLTFLIPMVIGSLGARMLFAFSWPSAILLASMFASHTLIPFSIVSRLGITRERAVVATVGGTILTDTAALLVLAIIAEMTVAELTAVFWLRQLAFLFALLWFALWLLPRLASLVFKMLGPDGSGEFVVTLTLVFLTGYLAHCAGVEPIIGAFFAGLSLSQLIPDQSPLKNRLEFVGNTLFIPFFLISVGMLVDLRVLAGTLRVWGLMLFMTMTVIVCKYAAAVASAALLRFNRDEANLMFGLSVNQAAATLAAVVVGLRLEIFSDEVLSGTIGMILVSCVVGSLFTQKFGQRVAHDRMNNPRRQAQASGRIIVAVSRSESAELLTDVALSARPVNSRESIFPLYVIQEGIDIDRHITSGEKLLGEVVAKVVAADVPVSPVTRIDVNVAGGILRAVKEHQAGVLIMGVLPPEQASLRRMLFDVADKVGDDSHQLLLLCQMSHPLQLDSRMVVLITPVLEYQSGFLQALGTVIAVATSNKLRLCIIGLPETVASVQRYIDEHAITVELQTEALSRWIDYAAIIQNLRLTPADAIVLMLARKGRLAWRPYYRKLCYDVRREFSRHNIIQVYPPDAELSQPFNSAADSDDNSMLPSLLSRPEAQLEPSSLADAVRRVLKAQLPARSPARPDVMKKLFPLDPVELTPGILLFHTHSEYVSEPLIMLGKCRNGAVFTGADATAGVTAFFILISPVEQTTTHLQALTQVARLAGALAQSQRSE